MKYFSKTAADMPLKDDWQNLKYIAKHKYYIYGPGRELGLSRGQLLKHDLSKFSRDEWGPYRDFFYSDKRDLPETKERFLSAVHNSHYKKNLHHTSYHEDVPFKYKLEEVVDWYAAAKTQSDNPRSFPSFKEWYLENRHKFINKIGEDVDYQILTKIQK
jgi:hypothetical protein